MAPSMAAPFNWLYRKLGPRYPGVFFTLELHTALLITLGVIGVFGFTIDGSLNDPGRRNENEDRRLLSSRMEDVDRPRLGPDERAAAEGLARVGGGRQLVCRRRAIGDRLRPG